MMVIYHNPLVEFGMKLILTTTAVNAIDTDYYGRTMA